MSVVRVKNLRKTTLVDGYDGTNYAIDAGKSVVVPLEAAKLWFGDWDTANKPERALRVRDDEFKRLTIRYGCADNPAAWEEWKPLVEVSDIDGEETFTTVIDDPTGTSVSKADVTVNEHTDMLEMIRQQSKELNVLKKQYEKEVREEQPESDADEDTPEPVASKRARRS
tara:strand:- start:940 stop:1446 length:507 start_codon:yes stop_codon:yes gene_type:complete